MAEAGSPRVPGLPPSSQTLTADTQKLPSKPQVIKQEFLYSLYCTDGLPSIHDVKVLRRWVHLLSKELGVELRLTHRVMMKIYRRISLIVTTVRRLRHGRQQKDYLDKEWQIQLTCDDIKSPREIAHEDKENAASVMNERLIKENAELKKSAEELKKKVVGLSRHVRQAKAGGFQATRGRSRVKSPSECSKRHRRNLKRKLTENCSNSLLWLESEGYTATEVSLHCTMTGESQTVSLGASSLLGVADTTITQEEVDSLDMLLYVKDKYNISGGAYHEMAQLCKGMPRHYKLKDRIAELNKLWNIHPTPEGTCGMQQSLKERLKQCLEHLISSSDPDAGFLKDLKVRVKLTGDGTNIGKRLHVVNFGFTILDEGDKAYSAAGNHCLAIFKEPESYDSLKKCLSDFISEVEQLKSIEVNGMTFEIDYYLGGDWKFLALATGIDSASSTYACIWCKCPASERHISSQKWSMLDPKLGARTIQENIRLSSSRSKNKYNVSRLPLFPNIPLTHVVVDNLHMFLRVGDTLIDLLIAELRKMDNVDKSLHVRSLDGLSHLATYQKSLQQMGISGFSFWIGKESKKLKWRTLTGPEKLIVFSKINIPELFPGLENKDDIQNLWRDLLEVNTLLSTRPDKVTTARMKQFQIRSKAFVDKFVELYPAKHVTPYMHCMMQHVSEFMELHGSILPFTQQGLEKYNDLMTKDFFRSTSHRGDDSLLQIMQKQNRIEHLEGLGVKRQKKHEITCGNCRQQGHNKWTCQAPCANCGAKPFKAHLIKLGSRKIASCISEN